MQHFEKIRLNTSEFIEYHISMTKNIEKSRNTLPKYTKNHRESFQNHEHILNKFEKYPINTPKFIEHLPKFTKKLRKSQKIIETSLKKQ